MQRQTTHLLRQIHPQASPKRRQTHTKALTPRGAEHPPPRRLACQCTQTHQNSPRPSACVQTGVYKDETHSETLLQRPPLQQTKKLEQTFIQADTYGGGQTTAPGRWTDHSMGEVVSFSVEGDLGGGKSAWVERPQALPCSWFPSLPGLVCVCVCV